MVLESVSARKRCSRVCVFSISCVSVQVIAPNELFVLDSYFSPFELFRGKLKLVNQSNSKGTILERFASVKEKQSRPQEDQEMAGGLGAARCMTE